MHDNHASTMIRYELRGLDDMDGYIRLDILASSFSKPQFAIMTVITPGIDMLIGGSALATVPITVALGLGKAHEHMKGTPLPIWVLVAAGIASIPAYGVLKNMSTAIKQRREAGSVGAQLVPSVVGKWIGNLDILNKMKDVALNGYPGDGLDEILEKYGPVVNIRVFWSDLMFTTSPEHVKLILATDFENYVKGKRFQDNMGDVLGVGVFNSDGDMWKFHRSLTRPTFSRDRISDFELFDRHAEIAIQELKSRLREGHPIDFQDLMGRFTLDSATEFLFGKCVDALSAGLPYPHTATNVPTTTQSPKARHADEFAAAFLQAQLVISQRERFGWTWPLFEMLGNKTNDPMKVVDAYIEPIIAEAIGRKSSGIAKEKVEGLEEERTLLDQLVQSTSDPKILKDETLNIMLAGRDTTAATLTFCIYFLSQYQHIMDRLRQEVLDKVGPTRRPTFDDVRDMKYLRAFINETLRLYPIVPFNIRESVNGTTWPNPDPNGKPFYIPPGTKTSYSVYMMHRRKDLWGPDAEEFDPDRFLDERKKYLIKNSFIFLPFNAGPRICLGQQYAYNETSFMLIRLLQNFSSISLRTDAFPPGTLPPSNFKEASGRKAIEKVWPKMTLTFYLAGGCWVSMEEANNS